jgi:hypothetical protein
MNTKTIIATTIVLLASLLNVASYAGERSVDFAFEATAGVESDSNVGIVELDDTSGEADRATLLTAGAKLAIPVGKPLTLRVGYDYSDTSYQQFSEFDLGLHHAMAEVAFSNRHFDAALTADRYEGVLDGEQYLSFDQLSPSLAKLFGNRVYLRAAYITSSKDYDVLSTRNADGVAARLDTYLLLNGMDHFLSLGLQHGNEDAVDDQLDFDTLQATLAYGYKLRLPLMQLNLKAQVRYEQRDYANVTEAIEMRRGDTRLRTSLVAAIPFNDHVQLTGSIERTDNESNLESAVIEKMVYGMGLKLRF